MHAAISNRRRVALLLTVVALAGAGPDLGSMTGPVVGLSDGRILFSGDGSPGSAGLVTAPE